MCSPLQLNSVVFESLIRGSLIGAAVARLIGADKLDTILPLEGLDALGYVKNKK